MAPQNGDQISSKGEKRGRQERAVDLDLGDNATNDVLVAHRDGDGREEILLEDDLGSRKSTVEFSELKCRLGERLYGEELRGHTSFQQKKSVSPLRSQNASNSPYLGKSMSLTEGVARACDCLLIVGD